MSKDIKENFDHATTMLVNSLAYALADHKVKTVDDMEEMLGADDFHLLTILYAFIIVLPLAVREKAQSFIDEYEQRLEKEDPS